MIYCGKKEKEKINFPKNNHGRCMVNVDFYDRCGYFWSIWQSFQLLKVIKKRFSIENRFFITFLFATSFPFQASVQPKRFDHQRSAFHQPVPVPAQATIQYILKLLRHTSAH